MTGESLGIDLGIPKYPLTWGFAARKMLHIHHGSTNRGHERGAPAP
jgi:hypothetical protein